MIDAYDGLPCRCGVACIASIVAGDVRGVFAGRSCAVVAGDATALHLSVIDLDGWFPDRHGMTFFARVSGRYMRGILSRSGDAVVALETIGGESRVIKEP